jgi:hypothetical protein
MNEESVDLKYYLSLMEKVSEKNSNKEKAVDEKKSERTRKIPVCEKNLWKKYKKLVWDITKQQKIHKLPNFEKRGFTNYHLDHKVSIWYGYKHKLNPKLIGSLENLEFIPYKENMRKGIKCNFKGAKNLQTGIFI